MSKPAASATQPSAIVPRCHMPWQQMVIDSSGYVAPCCYWGAVDNTLGGTTLGNFNTQTVDEIWNSPGYQRLRAGMAVGDMKAAGCADCQAVKQGMSLAFEVDPAYEQETGQPSRYAENIAVLKQEIATGAAVMRAKPTIVSYTPSHKCNIRCTHCYQETTRTAEISRRRADDDVEALAPYLVRIVAGGGEPFLLPIWRRFLTTFDLDKNPYLTFSTSTNATILSDQIVAGLKRFKKLTINVSMDGTGEAFERVRVGANFIEVRDNIRRLKTLVASADDTTSALGLSMCVMKSNIHDLPNFVRFCTEENLAFGLWPVTALPPAESLRHFVEPMREMQGWAEALDEAERLTHTLYLPHRAKLRNAPQSHETEHAFWRTNFQLLRDAVPFRMPRDTGRLAAVALPKRLIQQFPALVGAGLKVFVFQDGQTTQPLASGLVQDGTLTVQLPAGAYCVNVERAPGETPMYWDVVRFTLTDTDGQHATAAYRPFTQRRVKERLKRLGLPVETMQLPVWLVGQKTG
jgi:radical SAM protein with 4Fe4S-binding SPASM domain